MVLVIVVALIVGTGEVAGQLRGRAAGEYVMAAALRAVGADVGSDRAAAAAVSDTVGQLDDGEVLRLVVFDADADADAVVGSTDVPAGCEVRPGSGMAPSGVPGVCNVYGPTQIAQLGASAAWGCGPGAWDSFWCPTSRERSARQATHVGVFVEFVHRIAGMPGGPGQRVTVGVGGVARLDPPVEQLHG